MDISQKSFSTSSRTFPKQLLLFLFGMASRIEAATKNRSASELSKGKKADFPDFVKFGDQNPGFKWESLASWAVACLTRLPQRGTRARLQLFGGQMNLLCAWVKFVGMGFLSFSPLLALAHTPSGLEGLRFLKPADAYELLPEVSSRFCKQNSSFVISDQQVDISSVPFSLKKFGQGPWKISQDSDGTVATVEVNSTFINAITAVVQNRGRVEEAFI